MRSRIPWRTCLVAAAAVAAGVVQGASVAGRSPQSADSESALVATLLAAKTDEERTNLLVTHQARLNAGLWKALIERGERVRLQGDYPAALAAYRLARAAADRIGDPAGIARALKEIGVVHYLRSELELALEHYQKSLALYEPLGDKEGIADALTNIGLYHSAKANFAEARDYHQKSLALREEVGDRAKIGRSLLNLANVDYGEGDYRRALDGYRMALVHFEATGDKVASATALNNLAATHTELGAYGSSLEYGHRSLALQQALGHKEGIATILSNIGNTAAYQGRDDLSLRYHEQSLALREALGDRLNAARELLFIGDIHFRADAHQLALDAYRKSLAIQQAVGNKLGTADSLASIGHVLAATNQHEESLEAYRRSLALHEAIGGQRGMATVLAAIATAHLRLAEHERAVEVAERSSAVARQIDSRQILRESLTVAGRAQRALGRSDEARDRFEEAIAAIEAMRADTAGGEQERYRFLENRLAPYHEMIALLISERRPADALGYAERTKARVLLDVLRSGRTEITRAITPAEQAEERKWKGELASINVQLARERGRAEANPARVADLQARLEKARFGHEAFRTQVYAAHPELKAQRAETPVITLEEAGGLLPHSSVALLEYVTREDDTDLFVITREAAGPVIQIFSLGIGRAALTKQTESFRRALARRDLSFAESARRLYGLLLGPARERLADKTRLLIVPDGPLWELPFQALQSRAGRYVLEEHAIAYAPSLTALREMQRSQNTGRSDTPRSGTLLAFGNPALGRNVSQGLEARLMGEALAPLPEAERQVRALGRLYGPARSRTYVGIEAREERAKQESSRFRIVHFATHGLLNSASPMYSQLVLSQAAAGDGEDGLLEAREVMELDLNADLAVLSACETARGRVGAGEGLIGLTWAFFVAGTPTTVVSQWKVDSASTTDLMVELHRQLLAGRPTAEALQSAALKLLRTTRYRHPFYWAPFVVVGDAR